MTLIMVGMGDVVLVSLEQLPYLLFLRKLMFLDLAMLFGPLWPSGENCSHGRAISPSCQTQDDAGSNPVNGNSWSRWLSSGKV